MAGDGEGWVWILLRLFSDDVFGVNVQKRTL